MKLKHPDSNQTIEVDEDSVPNYESQGWGRASVPATRKPRATRKPKPKAAPKPKVGESGPTIVDPSADSN